MQKLRIYRRKDRGTAWQAQVYVGGKRYRFTCNTTDKRTARKYAEQKLNELDARHNRGLVGLPDPVRFSEVLDRYERTELPKLRPASQRRTAGIVAQARTWFVSGPLKDPQLTCIQPNDVLAFLDAKWAEGVSPRTVNLYRATLHRIFRLCVRPWLLIPNNPVAATETLREEPREPFLITEADCSRLLTSCGDNPMLRLFIVLAWEIGARSGELLQLEWSDVDFRGRFVTFANDPGRGRQTKGRRSRVVPLSSKAVGALRDHAARFRFSNQHRRTCSSTYSVTGAHGLETL
ncbi:MAG: tyrosine-type recombinase/integrase [Gemmatimonadetes bacterium]|nr:tyrosine-type recombinase/integrase [Gemmatimonadota bacterium]